MGIRGQYMTGASGDLLRSSLTVLRGELGVG